MKRYIVNFFENGHLKTSGHGYARDKDEAIEKAELTLFLMYNGTATYDKVDAYEVM